MRNYKFETKEIILTTTFSTPLGEMFAAASKKGIIVLTFFTPFHIEAKIETLKNQFNADVIPSNCEIFDNLKIQLNEYFNKQRTIFDIPLQLVGSPFQIKCWKELLNIPYGTTISYKQQAKNIENEKEAREILDIIEYIPSQVSQISKVINYSTDNLKNIVSAFKV